MLVIVQACILNGFFKHIGATLLYPIPTILYYLSPTPRSVNIPSYVCISGQTIKKWVSIINCKQH